ncbi:hypothetical protein VNO77_02868 [Canavalia gladiata]|uniref:Uncharacterized protein n=1 Tax=Canavalia gladiata TaxID=3824 RepID=A0AAN9MUE4_CANGL
MAKVATPMIAAGRALSAGFFTVSHETLQGLSIYCMGVIGMFFFSKYIGKLAFMSQESLVVGLYEPRNWKVERLGQRLIYVQGPVVTIKAQRDTLHFSDPCDGDDDNAGDDDEHRMVSFDGGVGGSSFQVPCLSLGTSVQRRDQSGRVKG